jgi:hypothetical protein
MNRPPRHPRAAEAAAPSPRPRRFASLLIRGVLLAGLAISAAAAGAQTSLTLYGGARGGGEFEDASGGGNKFKLGNGAAVSASVDWELDDGRVGQLFYSFQRTTLPGQAIGRPAEVGVKVSYLHLGGRAFFEGDSRQGGGYVVGGLGATFFVPGDSGFSDEVRPSANIGVGWQWMLARNVALRAELRGYLSLINSSGGFLCSGGCVVSIRGTTLVQGEGLLGVSIGF